MEADGSWRDHPPSVKPALPSEQGIRCITFPESTLFRHFGLLIWAAMAAVAVGDGRSVVFLSDIKAASTQ